jgi:hypothetical protein
MGLPCDHNCCCKKLKTKLARVTGPVDFAKIRFNNNGEN